MEENKILKINALYKRARNRMRGAVASLIIGGTFVAVAIGLLVAKVGVTPKVMLPLFFGAGTGIVTARVLETLADNDKIDAQRLENIERE